MELALQAPGIAIEDKIEKAKKADIIQKHIIKVEPVADERRNFSNDEVKVTHLTISEIIAQMHQSDLPLDAVLIDPQKVPAEIDRLRSEAKVNAVPLIVYTTTFNPEARKAAFSIGADDYHFGTINSNFLKRIDFIHKVKSYKRQRGDRPYEPRTMDPVPEIKLWSLKRTFDIVVSASALLLLSPMLLLISIIIMLESKGPILYISKRAGSGYKIFNFYKFRSMRWNADAELQSLVHMNQYAANQSNAVFFKIKDDPRITRFGEFLRKTSLDEIPQLFNVLIGDMSLVGNRPLPLYEAEKLTRDQIAWRFLAPAGITGLWQITKRGKDNMSEDERIALDMEYAMKNSFWLDLKILLATIPALVQREKV